MLLNSSTKEIFRAECNASFQSVHCKVHLNEAEGAIFTSKTNCKKCGQTTCMLFAAQVVGHQIVWL